jgi:hypothetical protein
MKWSKPSLVPLVMNAEIGAYQNDFDGDFPQFVNVEESGPAAVRREQRGAAASSGRDTARA